MQEKNFSRIKREFLLLMIMLYDSRTLHKRVKKKIILRLENKLCFTNYIYNKSTRNANCIKKQIMRCGLGKSFIDPLDLTKIIGPEVIELNHFCVY